MALEPGQQVDHYRLDRTIHRGRATVVFAATDLRSGEQAAVKVLDARYAADADRRQRFVTEAQVAARLDSHPNIATVHGWGQIGDSLYLVTELIDGVSLAELLDRRSGQPLPVDEALGLLGQIGSAIDFAHGRGAVHRDVRPANVMVTVGATPRTASLVDFGITKLTDADRKGVTGVYIGTADYAAPEQIAGVNRVDGRADVYSFGCVAFELLTGRPPYGDLANDAARIAAHLQASVPSANARRPELPAAVDAVFAQALAKDPAARPTRCGAVVTKLQVALGTGARPLAPPTGVTAALVRPATAAAAPDRSRTRLVAALASVAAVIAVVAAAVVVVGHGDGEVTGQVDAPLTVTASTAVVVASTAAATSTTTAAASTTTAVATTTAATTIAPLVRTIGSYGFASGAPVEQATGPESAFALGLQQRVDPRTVAAPGSPALWYAEWARLAGATTPGPVIATADGFAVVADAPVVLSDFVVTDGLVSTFTECAGSTCTPIDANVAPRPADCQPGPGCPHVRSRTGAVTAHQRATLLLRWPAQILLYELVAAEGRTVTAVAEPNGAIRYDPSTRYLVATFADRPAPGTTHQLTITFDDGSTDSLTIYYG